MTVELQTAIDGLYAVFQVYPLRPKIRHCACGPCAKDFEADRLNGHELRSLDDDTVGTFISGYRCGLWGATEDFKYLLPRGIELLFNGEFLPRLDSDSLGKTLATAEFSQWPERERRTIERVLIAAVLADTGPESEASAEPALILAAAAGISLAPFLQAWEDHLDTGAGDGFAGFFWRFAAPAIRKRRLDRAPWRQPPGLDEGRRLLAWFTSESLQAALSEVVLNSTNADRAARLSEILSFLEERTVQSKLT